MFCVYKAQEDIQHIMFIKVLRGVDWIPTPRSYIHSPPRPLLVESLLWGYPILVILVV